MLTKLKKNEIFIALWKGSKKWRCDCTQILWSNFLKLHRTLCKEKEIFLLFAFFLQRIKWIKFWVFLWQFGELFGSYTKYCTEQKNCTEYMKARYADNDLFKTFVVVSSSQSIWTLCFQTVHAVCERSCQRALLCSLLQSMWVMCHIRRSFN